jgi:gliding motility-associated-like protein
MKITLILRLFLVPVLSGFLFFTAGAQTHKLIHFWDFNNTVPLSGLGDVGGNGDSLGNAIHPLPVQYTTLPLAGAKIIYSRPLAIQPPATRTDSVLDNEYVGGGAYYYDFSSSHYTYFTSSDSSASATACSCPGNLFIKARNPCLNAYLYMIVPTTGYMNVTLSYAISASSNKAAEYNIFSYSTNGGTTWNKLTAPMDTFNISGVKHPDTLLALNSVTAIRDWYPVHIDFTSDGNVNNNGTFIVRFFFAGSNSTLLTGNNRYDNIAIQGDSVCPVIWFQPQNASICANSNTYFVTHVLGGLNTVNYQWQVNTGSGFSNVSNGGVYGGATTDSLILTNVPVGMNGYKYRCIISCIPCGNDTTTSALLTVKPLPAVTASATSASVCMGNSVTLTGGGAVSYVWTGGVTNAVPFVPVSTQTYTVTGTGANGCTDTASVTVKVNPLPTVTASATATTLCSGNSVTLTGGGAVSYTWTGGVTNAVPFVPASTQTYTVTGTDVNGCTNTASVTVTVNASPTVTVTPASASICYGNNTLLTTGGAVSYTWSPATGLSCTACVATTANPTVTTTYTVIGTASDGCIDSATVKVTVAPKIGATITGKDTICSGNSSTLSASGGGTYLWSTGSTTSSITVSPLTNTSYSVLVTVGSCTDSAKVNMIVNPSPSANITGKDSICAGTGTTLTATGVGTYSWSTGATTNSITVSPATTTTYSLSISNGLCTSDSSVTVTVIPIPNVTITAPITVCPGIHDTLTATGGTIYTWSNGATTSSIIVTPKTNTTYSVTVSNGFCTKDTSTSISLNPAPTPTITGNNAICSGDSTNLIASGGTSYMWNTGATTSSVQVKPAVTTTYTVQASNGICTIDTTMTVVVTPTPVPKVSGTQKVCIGSSVTLTASGGTTYAWLPSASLNNASIDDPAASPTVNTQYTVTMANGKCTATDSVLVIVNPLPAEAVSPNVTIQITQSTPLSVAPVDVNSTYQWAPSTGLSCTDCPATVASPTVTTKYIVLTTDSLGCIAIDTVTVNVIDDCGHLFIPNAFSPNGDGHNDILQVYGVCIEKMDFMVFDRWGNKIFESTEQAVGWDGTSKGQKMNPDTYAYYLSVTLADGTKLEKSGNVSLVR